MRSLSLCQRTRSSMHRERLLAIIQAPGQAALRDPSVGRRSGTEFPSHLAALLTVAVKATLANKNDVAVEFHLDDTTAALEHDFLSEIRFYIPPDKKDKDGDEKNGDPEQSAAERFQKRILAKADVISYAGSGIVVFKDLTLVFPRYAALLPLIVTVLVVIQL